eukprot:CAMPEP_0181190096 /NCGR_PEP_ID=MMETSP1096-20121128/12008_1 /TAXON_ID=156174 ORGANISM="Chrysochromulina ericina, Strain CCMP281" /NCGR_SAMPLE_ID=MMETSP1096 /ASSEMBLY_ACC=CAM_ASM_000453 /LENGTH=82 /DNA_ID=CAMNT_0023279283 /DNA_START=688 /DNA_END=932 /DNA_ORIENTATION=+
MTRPSEGAPQASARSHRRAFPHLGVPNGRSSYPRSPPSSSQKGQSGSIPQWRPAPTHPEELFLRHQPVADRKLRDLWLVEKV